MFGDGPPVSILDILQQNEVQSSSFYGEEAESQDEVDQHEDSNIPPSEDSQFMSFGSTQDSSTTLDGSRVLPATTPALNVTETEESTFMSFRSQGSQDSADSTLSDSAGGLPMVTSTPTASRPPSPTSSGQRRSRRTSEVLDDLQGMTISDNVMVSIRASALDSSVFAQPQGTPVRSAKKKKTSGEYSAARKKPTVFVPPPEENAVFNTSAFGSAQPRRSQRLSSDSSLEELDFHLQLSDSTWINESSQRTSTPQR